MKATKKNKNKMKDTNEMIEKLNKKFSEETEKLKKVMEELEKVMKVMEKQKEEMRCELEEIEDMNTVLLVKERESNDEIQEANKELIKGLRDFSGGESCKIGVKRMGEVDEKPFMRACKQRFSGEEAVVQYDMLCSKWQQNINNSAWHPFKLVETGHKMKEVVDEEDEKLENLREKWGEEVKNAVKTSLEELNEFNPSGRYIVPVAWNFEKRRKVTLKEGIAHLTKQISTLKRKHS